MGVVLAIYRSYRDPQAKSETTDSILALEIKTLKESLTNLKDNHIHTLEKRMDDTSKNLTDLTVSVGKLSTIIEERIPRKGI